MSVYGWEAEAQKQEWFQVTFRFSSLRISFPTRTSQSHRTKEAQTE
jgi:hypothetical protein